MTDDPGAERFEAVVSNHGSASILTVHGELDLDTLDTLSDVAFPAAEAATGGFVLDLTHVRFLSSSAITVLVRVSEHLPDNACMALVAVDGVVVRPIQLSGIDRVISTFDDLSAAISHVHPGTAGTEAEK